MEKEEEGGGRGGGEPRKRLGATVKSQVKYVCACVRERERERMCVYVCTKTCIHTHGEICVCV